MTSDLSVGMLGEIPGNRNDETYSGKLDPGIFAEGYFGLQTTMLTIIIRC